MAAERTRRRDSAASCLTVRRESLLHAVFLLPGKPLGLVIGGS